MSTRNMKQDENIIIQHRCTELDILLLWVKRLAEQSVQISITKEGHEWVISYPSGLPTRRR